MKLIKINTDHYIIVDDSEIEIGAWVLYKNSYIATVLGFPTDGGEGLKIQVVGNRGKIKTDFSSCKKITHSTQSLNDNPHYADYGIITLREVKELLGEVDVEQKYNATWLRKYESYESKEGIAFKTGYNQALEDNKDKKYTEENMIKVIEMAREEHSYADDLSGYYWSKEEIIQSIQPKSEWEVEFDENGKLRLV